MHFFAQHTGEIKAAGGATTICDYALIQDIAYAGLSDNSEHLHVMRQLYQHLYVPLPPPTLIVHLVCNEAELLARIHKRGRPEEAGIEIAYLAGLNQRITDRLGEVVAPIVTIRSDEIDFATNEEQAIQLKNQVLAQFMDLTSS